MDEEKTRLQMEIERYREKCNHEREKCIEVQSKFQTVEEQMRRIQEREENNTQKLLNSSANMEAVHKSKVSRSRGSQRSRDQGVTMLIGHRVTGSQGAGRQS